AEGFKESAADFVSTEAEALGSGLGVLLGRKSLFGISTDEQITDDAGALDAGDRCDLIEHARIEAGTLRGGAVIGSGKLGGDDSLGSESGIDILNRTQTSDQQSGAGEEHDRESEFGHHESAPHSACGDTGRDASSCFLNGGPQTAP